MLIYFPEIFVDGSIVTTHVHVPSLESSSTFLVKMLMTFL